MATDLFILSAGQHVGDFALVGCVLESLVLVNLSGGHYLTLLACLGLLEFYLSFSILANGQVLRVGFRHVGGLEALKVLELSLSLLNELLACIKLEIRVHCHLVVGLRNYCSLLFVEKI